MFLLFLVSEAVCIVARKLHRKRSDWHELNWKDDTLIYVEERLDVRRLASV